MFPYKLGYPRQAVEETPPRPTLYSVTRRPSGYAVCRDGAIIKAGCTRLEAEDIVAHLRAMDGIRARDSLTVYLDEDGALDQIRRGSPGGS
jgi:hypothetical protein